MKKGLGLIYAAFAVFCAAACKNDSADAGLEIVFDKPAPFSRDVAAWNDNTKVWESQTLPVGNGELGATIYGGVDVERIVLNEKSLWTGGPGTGAENYWNVNKESANVLPQIREAFVNGDNALADKLTRENFNSLAPYDEPAETPFRFGHYTVLGELRITSSEAKVQEDYMRRLSLDSSFVEIRCGGFRRQIFASYPHNALVIRTSSDVPDNLIFTFVNGPALEGKITSLTDCHAALAMTAVSFKGNVRDNGMKVALNIGVTSDGAVSVEGGSLVVNNATYADLFLTADTDYIMNVSPDFEDAGTYASGDPLENTSKWLSEAISDGADKVFAQHVEDYKSLFDRAFLKLGEEVFADRNITTAERLNRYREGYPDHYLETLYWQFGRYLLISSSRPGGLPANLQGVWAQGENGPWNVDYHNNINLQMNYWPALSTNLAECQQPLNDYIATLEKPGQKAAKAYFGSDGWTASISGNIFGFTSPLSSQDMSWNFSPMAGPWLAIHLWEYYKYTLDKDFLALLAYPLLRGSADFTVDYLWKNPDGQYVAAPSTSPEHGPIDKGATFAHAVAREILADAIAAAEALEDEDIAGLAADKERWQNVLDNIAPYQIGRYGQLMEWSEDIDDPEDHHRHVNHLFGLHPGTSISALNDTDLVKACRVVLEHRGDGATGWSMGWKLNQWARLLDGNHAYMLYGNLLKNGTLDNLWDSHPPFQIDGNFGGTAGVTEMLLQSHDGCINLLPALPDAWSEGRVKGLCAVGNIEVSMQWSKGRLTKAVLTNKSSGTASCTVRYGDIVREITLQPNKPKACKF